MHSGLTNLVQCYQALYLGSEYAPIYLFNYEVVLVSFGFRLSSRLYISYY